MQKLATVLPTKSCQLVPVEGLWLNESTELVLALHQAIWTQLSSDLCPPLSHTDSNRCLTVLGRLVPKRLLLRDWLIDEMRSASQNSWTVNLTCSTNCLFLLKLFFKHFYPFTKEIWSRQNSQISWINWLGNKKRGDLKKNIGEKNEHSWIISKMQDPNADTEWNDVLRAKGIIPPKVSPVWRLPFGLNGVDAWIRFHLSVYPIFRWTLRAI